MIKSYIYVGTYVIIMGLLFKLFAVGVSMSGKVEDYADNMDECLEMALKGQSIQDCIIQQDYSEEFVGLNEVIHSTLELNEKIMNNEDITYEDGILSFSYNGEIVSLPINLSKN